MKKNRKSLYKLNRKGVTLVELIVCFMLVSMFIACSTALVSSFYRVYLRVTNMTHQQSISDMLLESVSGDVSGAVNSALPEDETCAILISDEGSTLSYMNRQNYPVHLNVNENGYLNLQYQQASLGGAASGENVDWFYGSKAYMNNKIETLHFTHVNGTNLIRVQLVLKNQQYGYEYTGYRIIECYNLASANFGGEGADPVNPVDPSDPTINPDPDPGGESGNQLIVTGSDGQKHTVPVTGDWEAAKNLINNAYGASLGTGLLYHDATGYYIGLWGNWVGKDDNEDITLADIADKGIVVKVSSDTYVFTEKDKILYSNTGAYTWNPDHLPKLGDLCYYDGKLYLAPGTLNQWTFPPDGWILVK